MPSLLRAHLTGVRNRANTGSAFRRRPSRRRQAAARLEGFSLSKGTIRFAPDHPVPEDVLEEVVRLRRAEIQK